MTQIWKLKNLFDTIGDKSENLWTYWILFKVYGHFFISIYFYHCKLFSFSQTFSRQTFLCESLHSFYFFFFLKQHSFLFLFNSPIFSCKGGWLQCHLVKLHEKIKMHTMELIDCSFLNNNVDHVDYTILNIHIMFKNKKKENFFLISNFLSTIRKKKELQRSFIILSWPWY